MRTQENDWISCISIKKNLPFQYMKNIFFTYTLIEKQLNSMKKWAGFTCTNTCMVKKTTLFHIEIGKKKKKNYRRKEERMEQEKEEN